VTGPSVAGSTPFPHATAELNAALRHRMEELTQAYEWMRRETSRVHEEAAKVSGHAQSPGGTVTASVDAKGRLVALELEPRASRRLSTVELAATVVETVNKAISDAGARRAELLTSILPPVRPTTGVPADPADPSNWAPDQPLTDETFDQWFGKIKKNNQSGVRR
jgi:DNA-binding protein YbaB